MSDKLVTLAIRTYERAQMIKAVLEENGIETTIHNLNLEHPEMAVGVRVRIKEKDLPRALAIVEKIEKEWETENEGDKKEKKQILIPIDFSDQVAKSIDFGFYFAAKHKAEVVFLYVYYTPMFTISSNNDVSTYSISDGELLRRIITSANADVENMTNLIKRRIQAGELPKVPFSFELKEGVPEDQILDYCKKHEPTLVVMGTRGKKVSKTNELIGSVTAEVIDSCPVPVFALPIETPYDSPEDIKRVAFLTKFDQKDLIAIDSIISLFCCEKLEMHFIHVAEKNEKWDEIMLSGIKTYFHEHYPQLSTKYEMIDGDLDKVKLLDDYLTKQKIDLLSFNARRRNLFARLFNPGLAYKMVLHTDTPLFVTHV
ncbi:universal stress protein [Paludibacter sp. 221]|uniref:universal stress protein n=1 Tax=Paludibacter sp. 221 TaxID=2302939 RepID=UPI0013D7BF3A|nr:universal stress protein [Paludibacter sp. 221]NDV45936.1 universal stress protein [Paludibacter sp. 221]